MERTEAEICPYVLLPMKRLKDKYKGIIVSAPHTIEQMRDGKTKCAEPETGDLARSLHNHLGCPIICSIETDKGFCLDEYVKAIGEYHDRFDLHFLVDLHQMHPDRMELFDIGIGEDGENLLKKKHCIDDVKSCFGQFNDKLVSVNKLFKATAEYTVSHRVAKAYGIPCVQIEINSRILSDPANKAQVLGCLEKMMDVLYDATADFSFSQIMPQRIGNIALGHMVVSGVDLQRREIDGIKPKSLYRVYNDITQDSFLIKGRHILIDSSLAEGTIRLDARYRIFLGVDLPEYIPPAQWIMMWTRATTDEQALFSRGYPSEDHVLSSGVDQNDRVKLKQLIRKFITPRICVQETGGGTTSQPKSKSRIKDAICGVMHGIVDGFIGKSSIALMCRRPYKSDEGADVVRMSNASMKLLGIEEMDRVVLRYRDNELQCPVLPIDNESHFMRENRPNEINLSIGVPVHIRNRLGIQDVHSCIRVDRDTVFLLKKNMGAQTIPFLLTVSVGLFASGLLPFGVLFVIFVFLVAPLVIYFNLSQIRCMGGKTKE